MGKIADARRIWPLAASIAAAGFLVLAIGAPAHSVPQPDDPPPGLGDPLGSQVTVDAFPLIGGAQGSQDPTLIPTDGYPAFPVGLTPESVTTAQIQLRDTFGSSTGVAYCIDLQTETRIGTHYDAGEWTVATVPNLEYVSFILGSYFPNTAAPAGLSDTDKTAAVQAAIWFFTDNFVLTDASPLRPATQAIVADALANAGATPPPLPQLAVTPATGAVPTNGALVGPFVITGNVASAVVDQLGVQTYRDAAGTQPITSGDTVAIGASIWASYVSTTTPLGFRVTAVAEHIEGSVYLYNGSNTGVDDAQKLILATTTQLPTRAGVPLQPYEAGQLTVTKSITGAGAGLQGPVTIMVDCTSELGPFVRIITLPAATAAGTYPQTPITDLPLGASCTVSESADGANEAATLRSAIIEPASLVVAETTSVNVTNTYDPAPASPTLAPTGASPAASLAALLCISGVTLLLLARGGRRERLQREE